MKAKITDYPVISRALNGDQNAIDYLRLYDPTDSETWTKEDINEMFRKRETGRITAKIEEWRTLRDELRGSST